MSWRYQPIWIEDEAGVSFGLCEAYFDSHGRLEGWTEKSHVEPSGNDMEDLQGDLAHMMADAYKWKPVKHSDLHVGMTFERAISQAGAEGIADLIEAHRDAVVRATEKALSP